MDLSNPIVINGLALLGVVNVLSTIKVLMDKKLVRGQKLTFSLIVWLIPVLGVIWLEYRASRVKTKRSKKRGEESLPDPSLHLFDGTDL